MCGICGVYNFKTNRPADAVMVERMANSIVHRGPDDSGYFFDGSVGFGFRRLSIIDLAGGHQPMADATGRYHIVFNGEIYNYRELRDDLHRLGAVFQTESDTEVILNAYMVWGRECLNRLNGMFGFAIWDSREKLLLLARDAMGIKPVYISETEDGLIFASEMRALRAAGVNSRSVNPVALRLFLQFRFTPAPLTISDSIEKLAAGTAVAVTPQGPARKFRWHRFGSLSPGRDRSELEWVEELSDLYASAVRRQLVSDVPVGLFLSGGVDSALLLSHMIDNGRRWPTFSVGYGAEFRDDELDDAARTAAYFGSEHHSIVLDRERFMATLPAIVGQLEEPVASSSIVPMYHVARLAREHVKVALIGQGPDELFGGYKRHIGVRYGHMWRALPKVVRKIVKTAGRSFGRAESLARALYSLDTADPLCRYRDVLSLLDTTTILGLFRPEMRQIDADDTLIQLWQETYDIVNDGGELSAFQTVEIGSTLPDELLLYGDKMSMAHALEVRVPYLDRTIVDFALRVPPALKVRGLSRKVLHKMVADKRLPSWIVKRPKRAFAVNVVDEWFRHGMTGRANDVLSGLRSPIFEFLDPDAVAALARGHREGSVDAHKVLFSILVFDQWLTAQDAA